MRHQISRFAVHQTSKVVAIVYFAIGVILVPIFILAGRASPETGGSMVWLGALMPLIYAVFGYIFTAIALAVYNWVAGRVGGIELELASVDRA